MSRKPSKDDETRYLLRIGIVLIIPIQGCPLILCCPLEAAKAPEFTSFHQRGFHSLKDKWSCAVQGGFFVQKLNPFIQRKLLQVCAPVHKKHCGCLTTVQSTSSHSPKYLILREEFKCKSGQPTQYKLQLNTTTVHILYIVNKVGIAC